MNAAFGFRFAAAFFAIWTPCDERPQGRSALSGLYYAHSGADVPVFSEGKCEKSTFLRGEMTISRGEMVVFSEKRRGRSLRRARHPRARRAVNQAARAWSASARRPARRRFPQWR